MRTLAQLLPHTECGHLNHHELKQSLSCCSHYGYEGNSSYRHAILRRSKLHLRRGNSSSNSKCYKREYNSQDCPPLIINAESVQMERELRIKSLLSYYHPPRVVNIKLMTALHIRKNVREFFPWAASLPGTARQVYQKWQPDEQTIKNAIYSSRVSIATFFNHIH